MANLSNINNKFIVTDGGNVLIGPTGNTSYRLDVGGNIRVPYANGYFMDTTGALGSNFVKTINDYETVIGTGRGSAGFAVFGNSDIRIGFGTSYTTAQTSLFINNSGDVGIGTDSPGALLHIKGTGDAIRVESTNTGAGGAQIDLLHYSTSPADNDTMAYINMGGYYNTTPSQAYFSSIRTVATDISARQGELTFWTVNTTLQQRMVIDTDGNVGIGTSSPSSYDGEADNLVVYDAITPGITIALPQTTAAGSARGSVLFSDGTSGNEKYRGGVIYDHGTGMGGVADTMYLRAAVNSYLVLNALGNVGIGTKTPSRELDIQASSGWAEIALRGNTNGGGSLEFFTNTTKRAEIFADTEDIVFRNTPTNQERMRISNTGIVTIGGGGNNTSSSNNFIPVKINTPYSTTASPQWSLQGWVATTDGADPFAMTSGETTKNVYMGIIGAAYMNQNRFSIIQGGAERLTINLTQTGGGGSQGFIGIGTSLPSQKLDVVGLVKHQGLDMTAGVQVDQTTSISVSLNGPAGSWNETGIDGTDIGNNGSYVIQVYSNTQGAGASNYSMYWTGTMSWYAFGTNSSNTSEIYLNSAGHYRGMDLELRTISSGNGNVPPSMRINFKSNQTLSGHAVVLKILKQK
jgi:hypothetical protein